MNVSSKLDSVYTFTSFAFTKFINISKLRLRYKGYYLYNSVRTNKLLSALTWLKNNNPLYHNIVINKQWIDDFMWNNTTVPMVMRLTAIVKLIIPKMLLHA